MLKDNKCKEAKELVEKGFKSSINKVASEQSFAMDNPPLNDGKYHCSKPVQIVLTLDADVKLDLTGGLRRISFTDLSYHLINEINGIIINSLNNLQIGGMSALFHFISYFICRKSR